MKVSQLGLMLLLRLNGPDNGLRLPAASAAAAASFLLGLNLGKRPSIELSRLFVPKEEEVKAEPGFL